MTFEDIDISIDIRSPSISYDKKETYIYVIFPSIIMRFLTFIAAVMRNFWI